MYKIEVIASGESLGYLTKDEKLLEFNNKLQANNFIEVEELRENGLLYGNGKLGTIEFKPTRD